MEMHIIAMYCICDEVLKQLNFKDDPQSRMSSAEVMTTALVAASFFYGNQEYTCRFFKEHGYVSHMLSKSQFNRRLHAIAEGVWDAVFAVLSELTKNANVSQEYAVDSFPVPVCDNIRIFRSKIYPDEIYRGYMASKKRYFYGVRVHMIVTTSGQPVEFLLAPESKSDIEIFKIMNLNLPENSTIYADKAYNDYQHEDLAREAAKIKIVASRKKNSKRPMSQCLRYIHSVLRKRVETAFSQITMLFPKSIHAVTAKGFELKVKSFLFTHTIHALA